jgi:hypothetical protein
MPKGQEKNKEKAKKTLENLKKEDIRAEYERKGRIDAFEQQKKIAKDQLAEMDALLDPEVNPDSADPEGKEAGEWTELRKYIMIHFPEAKLHANLSANKIMVGIAHAMGKSATEISNISGIKRPTVYGWLKQAEVENLINEFRIKKGQEDPAELMTSIGYKALKMLDHILSLPVDSRNKDLTKLQQDTAKFQIQQAFGKATETINVNEVSYADVAKEIHKKKNSEEVKELTEEEKEALFQ